MLSWLEKGVKPVVFGGLWEIWFGCFFSIILYFPCGTEFTSVCAIIYSFQCIYLYFAYVLYMFAQDVFHL